MKWLYIYRIQILYALITVLTQKYNEKNLNKLFPIFLKSSMGPIKQKCDVHSGFNQIYLCPYGCNLGSNESNSHL
jgi:hypothetical protein